VAAAVAAAVAGSVLLRRRPLLAIGLLAAASVAFGLARNSPTISLAHYVAVDVALGFIVATRNRPTRIAALALTLAVIPGYARARMAFAVPAAGPPGWEVYVLTAVVAWLAGDSVRRARNYAGRLRAHAVAEAVTAERLRISRELHDLVAHSMGIITLQAGAAARVIDTQPQCAREALFEVENAGRGHDGRRRARRRAVAGRTTPAPAGCRAGRLPDRPGIGHQRGPSRRHALLPGSHRRRRRGRVRRGRRPRAGAGRRPVRYRMRPGRDARAGRPDERRFQRRTGTRRRLRRPGALAPASQGDVGVTIRVLLADDQPLIRTALQMVITDTDDIEVAGEVQLVIIAYDAGLVAPAR
jgi:hypothetical protein